VIEGRADDARHAHRAGDQQPVADGQVPRCVEHRGGEQQGQAEEDVPGDDVDGVEHRWPLPGEQVLEAVDRARVDPAGDGEQHQVHGHREARHQQHPAQRGHGVGLGAVGRAGMDDHGQQDQDRAMTRIRTSMMARLGSSSGLLRVPIAAKPATMITA